MAEVCDIKYDSKQHNGKRGKKYRSIIELVCNYAAGGITGTAEAAGVAGGVARIPRLCLLPLMVEVQYYEGVEAVVEEI